MNEKKRSILSTGIRIGSFGPDIYMLREAAKSDPAAFMHRMQGLVDGGQIGMGTIKRWDMLFAALQDIQVPVTMEVVGVGERAIQASAFPVLAGNVIVKAINDKYLAIETIGQELVEEMDDAQKITTVAAVSTLDKDIEEVKETEDFPEIGAMEETVEIRHKRNGRLFTISAECVEENRGYEIQDKANGTAQIASDWIEEQTIKRVTDYNGSKASAAEPYVYRPSGAGAALFSATANTPGTRAPSGTRINSNALVDESDLEAARIRLNTMKDNRGKRIAVPQSERCTFIPDALLDKMLKIANSEFVPGVFNEKSSWGPGGKFMVPVQRIFSSPKLDDLSASAWYYGAPKRQFRRKWKLRLEYVTLGMNTESYLRKRIAFQARVAWDVEVGATDYVYWIQCLAATTAPGD